MKKAPYKRGFFLSFFGHLAAFSIFSFSFGTSLLPGPSSIIYRGNILNDIDFKFYQRNYSALSLLSNSIKAEFKNGYTAKNDINLYSKPAYQLALVKQKSDFIYIKPAVLPSKSRPAIILHPQLPRYFSLYFKDRETVHIELTFSVKSFASGELIEVKRKISSGNLEADLISMRYINRYIFMQRKMFTPDIWQAVKIDLSVKND